MRRTRMSWKQILCILLALIFVTQLVPAPVLAEMVSDTTVSDAQELKLSSDTVVATKEAEPATILGEVEELREENELIYNINSKGKAKSFFDAAANFQKAAAKETKWVILNGSLGSLVGNRINRVLNRIF